MTKERVDDNNTTQGAEEFSYESSLREIKQILAEFYEKTADHTALTPLFKKRRDELTVRIRRVSDSMTEDDRSKLFERDKQGQCPYDEEITRVAIEHIKNHPNSSTRHPFTADLLNN